MSEKFNYEIVQVTVANFEKYKEQLFSLFKTLYAYEHNTLELQDIPRPTVSEYTEEMFYGFVNSSLGGCSAFVAVVDEEVVSMAWGLKANDEIMDIASGFTKTKYRGCGIYASLTDRLEEWGQSNGINLIRIVVVENNPVMKLYAHKGYEPQMRVLAKNI